MGRMTVTSDLVRHLRLADEGLYQSNVDSPRGLAATATDRTAHITGVHRQELLEPLDPLFQQLPTLRSYQHERVVDFSPVDSNQCREGAATEYCREPSSPPEHRSYGRPMHQHALSFGHSEGYH